MTYKKSQAQITREENLAKSLEKSDNIAKRKRKTVEKKQAASKREYNRRFTKADNKDKRENLAVLLNEK